MYANNVRFDGIPYPGEVTADGQLLIGSTASPNIRVNTLTAGSGIGITNGPGTIQISSASGGMAYLQVSIDTVMSVNTCYTPIGGVALNFTLPSTPVLGDVVEIISQNTQWNLVGPELTVVAIGARTAKLSPLGGFYISPITITDSLTLRFTGTETDKLGNVYNVWTAEGSIGNYLIVDPLGGNIAANAIDLVSSGIPIYDGLGYFTSTTTTQYAPLVGDASNAITSIGPLTDGQLLIGSTGNNPSASTLTAGTNIGITNASGSVTINVQGLTNLTTWKTITADQTAVVGEGYFCNKAGLLSLSLPASSAVGDVIEVANINTALGVTITQGANQEIFFGSGHSTNGAAGSYSSTDVGDCLKLVCRTANLEWQLVSNEGNWTPA